MKRIASIAFLGVMSLLVAASPAAAVDAPVSPTVIGPIPVNANPGDPSHDYTFFTPTQDLGAYGYVQEEFFLQGTAKRYGSTGLRLDTLEHPYKTRIVVRRPISAKRFNGVVLAEWQNVTAGYDLDAHWGPSWEHIMRSGYAWVGISAQRVGVHQAGTGLKAWSPVRYGSLDLTDGGSVTDDSLCYDVFSQAALALQSPAGVDPMGGLTVSMVLAIGASQSAGRLVIYFNAIHPAHDVYDAFYLLVGGTGTRTDLSTKVFQILSEREVMSSAHRRIPDSDNHRLWEIAGAAHSGFQSAEYRAPILARDGITPSSTACDLPPYSHVPTGYALNAAYDHLARWVKDGTAPPTAPLVEMTQIAAPTCTTGCLNVIKRDSLGMALGGLRLPYFDVPTAFDSGNNSGPAFCVLYGTHHPFDSATLRSLYRNHGDFVSAFNASVTRNLAGFIVEADAQKMRVDAAHADVP
jgi:hypothetical protein